MLEIAKAIKLCFKAHKNQVDKSGDPYWKHPLWVFNSVRKYDVDNDTKVAALLHDVVEDTHLTDKDLRDMGFSSKSIDIIMIVTKPKWQDYLDYVNNVVNSGNKSAILIKYIDIMHNLSYNRIKKLSYEDQKRLINKYSKALEIVTKEIVDA